MAKPDPQQILIVDDDEAIRASLRRVLHDSDYATVEAGSVARARRLLVDTTPDVALLDLQLPDGSGLDLTRAVLESSPETAVIIVSGNDSPIIARTAVDLGVYGYLTKPFSPNALILAVYNALRRRDLERTHRRQRSELSAAVCDRTSELRSALAQLRGAMAETKRSWHATVDRLSRAIEYRDTETSDHVLRMSRHCGRIAGGFALDEHVVTTAASMHDVGKIGVPDAVLRKPARLTPDERCTMERHTVIGHDLLTGSGAELLDLAATIALTHHERWDGSGYPNGLCGTGIPLVGRIAAVADVLDAITQPRVYRSEVMTRPDALRFIARQAGTHFDPQVVDMLFATGGELGDSGVPERALAA